MQGMANEIPAALELQWRSDWDGRIKDAGPQPTAIA